MLMQHKYGKIWTSKSPTAWKFLLRKSPYSVRIRENTDWKISREFKEFDLILCVWIPVNLWNRFTFEIQRQPTKVFCRKCVLNFFGKLTGKYLSRSLFFNKVAWLRPVTLFEKRDCDTRVCCEFCEIFKNIFFIESLWWDLSNRKCSKLFKVCWYLV